MIFHLDRIRTKGCLFVVSFLNFFILFFFVFFLYFILGFWKLFFFLETPRSLILPLMMFGWKGFSPFVFFRTPNLVLGSRNLGNKREDAYVVSFDEDGFCKHLRNTL